MNATPTVSAVIPCRNERDHIEACLRSILAQEPPLGGFEVIVVDGMSDDGTRGVLQRLAADEPRLRIVDNPAGITPCAMNAGIEAARGQYIAIMGAHNRYAPDYLRRSVEVLEATGAHNVGGAMVCEAATPIQRAMAAAHHSPFSVGGARWHNPNYEGPADTVFGGVYRREVFDSFGNFDEELVRNQDDEFNLRLTRAGRMVWQSPLIRSWYHPRGTLSALFQQYMQYGYWKVRVIQKHKLPASTRHLVPAIFILLLMILPLVSVIWRPAAWLWLTLVSGYLLANLAASAITAGFHGWELFPMLPRVFAAYHFAYGGGFLLGCWHFLLTGRRAPRPALTQSTRATLRRAE